MFTGVFQEHENTELTSCFLGVHSRKGELKERFPILENGRFTQDLSGIHRLGKLTVNGGFLAVLPAIFTYLIA